MVTYEIGKADADAPVTWHEDNGATTQGHLYRWLVFEDGKKIAVGADFADPICRAFHFAKLARPHVESVRAFGPNNEGARELLRRFDQR